MSDNPTISMVEVNFPLIASMKGKEQQRLLHLGLSASDAYKEAVRNVGMLLEPRVSYDELNAWLTAEIRRRGADKKGPDGNDTVQPLLPSNDGEYSVSSATFPENTPRVKRGRKLDGQTSLCANMRVGDCIQVRNPNRKRLHTLQSNMKHIAKRLKWGANGKGTDCYQTKTQILDDGEQVLFIKRVA